MKRLGYPLMVSLCFASISCARSTNHIVPDTGFHDPGQGNTGFAFALFARLCRDAGEENVMFSPISISSALAMTWAGAGGETGAQMAAVLGFDEDQAGVHGGFSRLLSLLAREGLEQSANPVVLNIANALWVQQSFPLLNDYTDLVRNSYRAEARNMNFMESPDAQRVIINEWVAEKTAQRITDLLGYGSVTGATRVVLTSAVYFLGTWQYEFNRDLTREGTFTTLAGNRVSTPFMHRTGDYPHYQGQGFSALDLRYSDGMCRMILVLPDGAPDPGLLSPETLRAITSGFQTRKVALAMPSFEFTASCNLAGNLQAMGMEHAFSENLADFSGFTGGRDLFISDVVHKAFVKVDESGTEAAAATGVVMATTAMPADPPVPFVLDRPFIFLIVDDLSETVLFIGRVADPTR